MLIYPAIDIMGGKAVRLKLGRFDDATTYGDPVAQAAQWSASGAEWIHVVDLDGAKNGALAQLDLLKRMTAASKAKVQCGGGVRERAQAEALFEAGVSRVVIGSSAAKRPDEVRQWIADFGVERVCCAFDVKPEGDDFIVSTHGWTAGSGLTLAQALALYPPGTLKHVLVTDVSRDGVMAGPNIALMQHLMSARADLVFQASGGVSSLADVEALRRAGAPGVIIGRALYERAFTLEQALAG
jgi:phosphoribosylformimino-5-aminoimidazole carboxamide ribotide isomerase